MPHPPPDAEGHYWAKLVHPSGESANDDLKSVDWEVVQVWDNNATDDERWGVSVPGIEGAQWVPDFVWGPRVPDFKAT